MTRDEFDVLFQSIEPFLPERRHAQLTAQHVLAAVIKRLAQNETFQQVQQSLGLSRSVVHAYETSVLKAICQAFGGTICFPSTEQEWKEETARWTAEDPYFIGVASAGDGSLVDFIPYGKQFNCCDALHIAYCSHRCQCLHLHT